MKHCYTNNLEIYFMWRLAVHTFLRGSDYEGILLSFFSREVRGSCGSSPIDPRVRVHLNFGYFNYNYHYCY